jgi:hypothetical protein
MKRLAVLCLLLPLHACSRSEPLALSIRNDAPTIQPVHSTLYSNLREPRRMLIRDAESWAAVWADMISVGDSRTPPFVDFSKEDVIVAALGERRSNGYSISITGVLADPFAARVIVSTTAPGASCDQAEIVTAPLDAVRISKLDAAVQFDERNTVLSCD